MPHTLSVTHRLSVFVQRHHTPAGRTLGQRVCCVRCAAGRQSVLRSIRCPYISRSRIDGTHSRVSVTPPNSRHTVLAAATTMLSAARAGRSDGTSLFEHSAAESPQASPALLFSVDAHRAQSDSRPAARHSNVDRTSRRVATSIHDEASITQHGPHLPSPQRWRTGQRRR